jgi:NAD(P)-dependent dehydrogenase (short-subunit alcohol dehydrogenase family)
MGLFQPSIPPLKSGIDLTGQTVVITGASSGIGLAVARRIVKLRASNVILAVRDVPKGEAIKASFLKDSEIQLMNPSVNIQVMQLDMETYESPMAFVSDFRQHFSELHVLLLNAGGVSHQRALTSTGHEKTVQVNYLSNVFLLLQLLPLLESTAQKIGKPTRVTWTGSRSYRQTSLKRNALPEKSKGWLDHFDTAEGIPLFNRYADSKLLGLLLLSTVSVPTLSTPAWLVRCHCTSDSLLMPL